MNETNYQDFTEQPPQSEVMPLPPEQDQSKPETPPAAAAINKYIGSTAMNDSSESVKKVPNVISDGDGEPADKSDEEDEYDGPADKSELGDDGLPLYFHLQPEKVEGVSPTKPSDQENGGAEPAEQSGKEVNDELPIGSQPVETVKEEERVDSDKEDISTIPDLPQKLRGLTAEELAKLPKQLPKLHPIEEEKPVDSSGTVPNFEHLPLNPRWPQSPSNQESTKVNDELSKHSQPVETVKEKERVDSDEEDAPPWSRRKIEVVGAMRPVKKPEREFPLPDNQQTIRFKQPSTHEQTLLDGPTIPDLPSNPRLLRNAIPLSAQKLAEQFNYWQPSEQYIPEKPEVASTPQKAPKQPKYFYGIEGWIWRLIHERRK